MQGERKHLGHAKNVQLHSTRCYCTYSTYHQKAVQVGACKPGKGRKALGTQQGVSFNSGTRLEMISTAEVTFEGTKFFWKTRNTVDVVIAHHKESNVFEVIVYEPSLDREAPRLYLNEEILMSNVDHNEIDNKISFANRNNVPLTEKLITGFVNRAVADFVLNRLVIQELVVLEKKFVVGLVIDDNDVMLCSDFKELVCTRPEAVAMHQVKHYRNHMHDAAVAVIQALEEEKKQLTAICAVAAELSSRVTPIVRDRWRMPIVLNKVFRGASLCKKDAKIFERIKANMQNEADISRMHAVMHSTGPQGASPAAKHGVGHEHSMHSSHARPHAHAAGAVGFNRHTHGPSTSHGRRRRHSDVVKHHMQQSRNPVQDTPSRSPKHDAKNSTPREREQVSPSHSPKHGIEGSIHLKRASSISRSEASGDVPVSPRLASKPVLAKKKSKRARTHSKASRVAATSEHPSERDEQFVDLASQLSDSGDLEDPEDSSGPAHHAHAVEDHVRSLESQPYDAPTSNESALSTNPNPSAEFPGLEANTSAQAAAPKSFALGSYLWGLTANLLGSAPAVDTQPASQSNPAGASAPAGWMPFKKVAPVQ